MGLMMCERHGRQFLRFVSPAIGAETSATRFWEDDLFLLQLRLVDTWGWSAVDAGFLRSHDLTWTEPFRTVIVDDEDRSWALFQALEPHCTKCVDVTLTKRSFTHHPARWAHDRMNELESQALPRPTRVTGVHETRATEWREAQVLTVDLMVVPAPAFHVTNLLPKDRPLRAFGLLDTFIYGFLDILMTGAERKIDRIHVILEGATSTRPLASEEAARLAGRDAGRKILAAVD